MFNEANEGEPSETKNRKQNLPFYSSVEEEIDISGGIEDFDNDEIPIRNTNAILIKNELIIEQIINNYGYGRNNLKVLILCCMNIFIIGIQYTYYINY